MYCSTVDPSPARQTQTPKQFKRLSADIIPALRSSLLSLAQWHFTSIATFRACPRTRNVRHSFFKRNGFAGLWQMSSARRPRQFPHPSRHIVRFHVRFNLISSSHEWGSCAATLENGRGRLASRIRSNEHAARDTRVTSNHPCFVFHRRITISRLSAGVREILHGVH